MVLKPGIGGGVRIRTSRRNFIWVRGQAEVNYFCGKWDHIVKDPDVIAAYNEDALGIQGGFEGVFRPVHEKEIIEFVNMCRGEKTAITAQGLRSSLTGASICDKGIALSLEKMNRIIDIDPKRRVAVVEPGIITSELRRAVAELGLFYPPDPTSADECTIGGNVATNASGSCTLKYGSTKDWVKRLRVVTGTGECIEVKSRTSEKYCAGYGGFYQPTHLFHGSEGTLGIITEIEVSLTVLPPDFFLAMAFFKDMDAALNFTIEARDNPAYSPRSIEFLDDACLDIIRPRAEGISIPRQARVMIYFEQEHENEEDKDQYLEQWFRLIEKHTVLSQDTQVAFTNKQKSHLLGLRHHVPQKMNEESTRAVKRGGCKISTDWAVPYRKLPELFAYFDTIRSSLGDMTVVRFAHIGEGHPHFNFIAGNPEEKRIAEEVDLLMARKAVELGGTISGEHGIGKMKRDHMVFEYPKAVIEAMRATKRIFDPGGIMAPGNVLP